MRDIEVIDSELRLLLAIRRMVREEEGRTLSTTRIDELLNERSATVVLSTTVGPAQARPPAARSLQWRVFPLLSGFLRSGGRGVGLVEDVRMHAILPDLPNHQNPRPVLASA